MSEACPPQGGELLLSRRRLLVAGGIATAGLWLPGCGHGHRFAARAEVSEGTAPAETDPAAQLYVDRGADATEVADRGDRIQVDPIRPPELHWRAGQFITAVETDQPFYAGTLDDGPSPYNTYDILRAARKYNVKLSFAVVGIMARAFPEILRAIYEDGHQIINHSSRHTPYTSMGLAPQIAECQEIIYDILGIYPEAARAPGLTRGAAYLAAVLAAGMYEVQTSWVTTDSSDPRPSAAVILQQHIRGLVRGGIELNHDGGNRRPTSDAYDDMLAYASQVGITSVRVDELIAMGTPLPLSGTYPNGSRTNREGGLYAPEFVGAGCEFDVYQALKEALEYPYIKSVQRSRVVAELAELDLSKS